MQKENLDTEIEMAVVINSVLFFSGLYFPIVSIFF